MDVKYPVAFITSHGHFDTWCGGQESHFQILRNLSISALSITTGKEGVSRKLQEQGFPVEVVPFSPDKLHGFRRATLLIKLKILLECIGYCLRVYLVLKKYGVRVAYTVIGPAVLLAPFPVKLAGAKLVTGIRGTPFRMARWKWVFRLSDQVAVLSQETKDILIRGLSNSALPDVESKMTVIFNGVDLDNGGISAAQAEEARCRHGIRLGDLMVLYAAAFRPYKGQLKYIREVLPLVLNGGLEVHSVFIGGASTPEQIIYERACREASAGNGTSDYVHFAGFQLDVWPWYRTADMVVLASENLEGMARVIIEAMACGKPVVCYDVCSARELLEKSGAGIVVPQDDAHGLAGAILNLAKNPALRKEMGSKGREYAMMHLDIKVVSKAYEKLFQEVLLKG